MSCPEGYEGVTVEGCDRAPCQRRCQECAIGYYKNEPGDFACQPCPENATTVGNASNSIDLCNIGM